MLRNILKSWGSSLQVFHRQFTFICKNSDQQKLISLLRLLKLYYFSHLSGDKRFDAKLLNFVWVHPFFLPWKKPFYIQSKQHQQHQKQQQLQQKPLQGVVREMNKCLRLMHGPKTNFIPLIYEKSFHIHVHFDITS